MTETMENRQFRFARRPTGLPERDDFELTSEALRDAGDGEVRVAIEYISLDPAMRGRAGKSGGDGSSGRGLFRIRVKSSHLSAAGQDDIPSDFGARGGGRSSMSNVYCPKRRICSRM